MQGYPEAQLYLGQSLLRHHDVDGQNEGVRWLQRAGAGGAIEAYLELANRYAMTGDARRGREYAEVVVSYGNAEQKATAEALLRIIQKMELDDDIRRFDGTPFAADNQG